MSQRSDITRVLGRIEAVLSSKQQAGKASRDIRLGLERISRVVNDTQKWNGVHVGGTNGKGSICAFLSGLFTLAGVSYGRYVSPAFPHPRDGITINGRTVRADLYDREKRRVHSQYQKITRGWRFATSEHPGDLSPFELLTATAFHLFNRTNVDYGIVEVGMGGATDATNVMKRKAVTVISKIDLDHQEFLGNRLEDIAKVKAGIMRPGIPCIVDHTNSDAVMSVLREHARSIGAPLVPTWKGEPLLTTLDNERWQLEDYQRQNLLCAAMAFRHIFPYRKIDLNRLMEMEPYLPGRMEWVDVSKLTDDSYRAPVLVDAAHNMLGVQSLAKHVDTTLRTDKEPITWIMGMSSSKTKPFDEMISTLVRPHDNVAFVEYHEIEGDPTATPAPIGRDIVRSIVATDEQVYGGEPDVLDAFKWAVSKETNGPIIVTGSLYLIRDFYNLRGLRRYRQDRNRMSGSSELWRLSQLERHRPLNQQEFEQLEKERSLWKLSERDTASEGSEATPVQESSSGLQEADGSSHETIEEAQKPIQKIIERKTEQDEVESAFGDHSITYDRKAKTAELNKLHFIIYRHRYQLNSYRSALISIRTDINELKRKELLTDGETLLLSQLQEHTTLLQQQADKHLDVVKRSEAEYFRIREQVKTHRDAKRNDPGLPKPGNNPFFAPTELDQPKQTEEERQVPLTPDTADQLENQEPADGEEIQVEETDFWGRKVDSETKP